MKLLKPLKNQIKWSLDRVVMLNSFACRQRNFFFKGARHMERKQPWRRVNKGRKLRTAKLLAANVNEPSWLAS